MPLPSIRTTPPPIPNTVSSLSSQAPARRIARRSARIKKIQADKKRANLLRKRVLQHLQEVEQLYQGKPRRSIRLYIKRCNRAQGPSVPPFCSCVLFGEERYFFDEQEKTCGSPDGFRIVVHDGEDEDDSDSGNFEDSE